jgi:hypothetical protein
MSFLAEIGFETAVEGARGGMARSFARRESKWDMDGSDGEGWEGCRFIGRRGDITMNVRACVDLRMKMAI